MTPGRIWLLLTFLLLAACQSGPSLNGAGPVCRNAKYSLPIHEANGGTKIYVDLRLDAFGAKRVVLDTGAGANVRLMPAIPGGTGDRAKGERVFLKQGQWIPVDELGGSLYFYSTDIDPQMFQMLGEMQVSEFILNPDRIDPDGYTVVDLRHRRLIGFADAGDVANCVGHGTRSQITAAERKSNYVFIDALIDGHLAGRVEVDTGEESTEFYNPLLHDATAVPAHDLHYYRIGGTEIVPRLSRNHQIRIGGTTRPLPVVADLSDLKSDEALRPDARLGYATLNQSILIFPPAGAGYWELIF